MSGTGAKFDRVEMVYNGSILEGRRGEMGGAPWTRKELEAIERAAQKVDVYEKTVYRAVTELWRQKLFAGIRTQDAIRSQLWRMRGWVRGNRTYY